MKINKTDGSRAGIVTLVSLAVAMVGLVNIDNGGAFPWIMGLGIAGFIGGIYVWLR